MDKLVVYSASWCANCPAVKEYIKKHELDVDVVDIDLHDVDFRTLGIKSVPALKKEGEWIYGSGSIISYLGGLNG